MSNGLFDRGASIAKRLLRQETVQFHHRKCRTYHTLDRLRDQNPGDDLPRQQKRWQASWLHRHSKQHRSQRHNAIKDSIQNEKLSSQRLRPMIDWRYLSGLADRLSLAAHFSIAWSQP